MPWLRILADLIVVLHAAFVAFVVLGLPLIVLGIAFRWGWVRNAWFRWLHLAAIGFVVFEAVMGMTCPLTDWENRLRQLAGEAAYPGDFIGHWAHELIFYDAEPWVFTAGYIAFGLAVLAAFVLAPPRWRRPSAEASAAAPRQKGGKPRVRRRAIGGFSAIFPRNSL